MDILAVVPIATTQLLYTRSHDMKQRDKTDKTEGQLQ